MTKEEIQLLFDQLKNGEIDKLDVSKQDFMDNELMLGLRKVNGINIEEFESKYDISLFDAYPVKPLINSKDLIVKKGYIFINPRKLYIMNEILLKLI